MSEPLDSGRARAATGKAEIQGPGSAPARPRTTRQCVGRYAIRLGSKMAMLLDGTGPTEPFDPVQDRRARLLSVLLLGTLAGSALVLLELSLRSLVAAELAGGRLLLLCLASAAVAGLLLVANRRLSPHMAAGLFVFFLTGLLFCSDSPEQLVSGRSTWFLALPVFISSMVLPPVTAFATAGLVIAGLVVVSHWSEVPLTTIQASGFGLVALVGWLSTRSLEQAFSRLEMLNRELDSRVAARTHELEVALARLEESQAQRLQAQKLAAVGQLAGGIAHEVNNPLGVILGFAQVLERRVAADDPLHLPVTSIVRESLRCKNLVQELLTFAHTAKKTAEDVDLGAVVRSSVILLESRARMQAVHITVDLADDIPKLHANKTQIQQIVVNLATNALDAMPAGGSLTIRTRRSDRAEVALEIADTGHGIPDDIRTRIFEPFFTSREAGRGTGLGLSIVYEIVRQHEGSIQVTSESEKGTVFSIRLPTWKESL